MAVFEASRTTPRAESAIRLGVWRSPSGALHLGLDRWSATNGLVNDTISLGELEQVIELLLRHVGINLEVEPERGETDRRVFSRAKRAAEIEIALGTHCRRLRRDLERGPNRLQGDAGAGDERFKQHVARAQLEPRSSRCWMQACNRQRAAGLDLAGDVLFSERTSRPQCNERRFWLAPVAIFDRSLQRPQVGGVHIDLLSQLVFYSAQTQKAA